MEGTWYQTYASRATDSYGCLSYTITPVPDANTGDLPAVDISTAWSAFNTYWNPFQKGQYAHKYELYGDKNGRLFERNLTTRANTFSYIIAASNAQYFVEYSCNQTLMDLWTIEYIDVFEKSDQSVALDIDTIKATILTLAPNFPVDTIVEAK